MNIPRKDNPVLFDRVIQQLQDIFKSKLSWLDYAFGRACTVEAPKDEGTRKFPAVYTAEGEYISVLPDDTLGNFLFFEIYDPIAINKTNKNRLTAKGAIVFWLRLDTVFDALDAIYNEEIKLEVLKLLYNTRLTAGRVSVLNIYEDAVNIYKGYDTSQIEGQYLLFPYYGFKIEVEFDISELCI